jgi:hypothetical protein
MHPLNSLISGLVEFMEHSHCRHRRQQKLKPDTKIAFSSFFNSHVLANTRKSDIPKNGS